MLLAAIEAIIGYELVKSQRACCDITYMIMFMSLDSIAKERQKERER